MFSLTICFGPAGTLWQLMFREESAAKAALAIFTQEKPDNADIQHRVADDFGQIITFSSKQIHGYVLEDLQLSKAAHIERALHQARTQAEAAQMAESDSVLRAQRARQGPAIIDPMGMPRGYNGGGFPR